MKIIIFGGAGFIGSYLVEHFLGLQSTKKLTVYDNFSSGNHWHLSNVKDDKRLDIVEADISELGNFKYRESFDLVIMLAANPDIAKASTVPDIDFHEGTVLMNNVLEFMRINSISRLIYASGSGVYGDVGDLICDENYGPMLPISTYGASKLSCEALISSYTHMFGLVASCFRFGNAVGGRQTHGVAYDFIRRLKINSHELEILGDGQQSKPYVYIEDIVSAIDVVLKNQKTKFEAYNVAPTDSLTVTEIAQIVIQEMGLDNTNVRLIYTGGDRGWKGDVPVVRLNSEKIILIGWKCNNMSRDAVKFSVQNMITNIGSFENE
jgi:UDP-glucose 4-epimerase